MKKYVFIWGCIVLSVLLPYYTSHASDKKPLYNPWLADYTSAELDNLLHKGYDRIIIPTAGIEQNGQFASLNKHEKILIYTMPKIAHRLDKTLIAPIINYVPEGTIFPPTGHMAFTGTISVSEFVFKSILLNTVFSLSQHGFKKFYFLGDSGSNQTGQHNAATFLQSQGYNAHHIPAYYANDVQNHYLIKKYGFTLQQIGTHIGIRDTSELLYASPESVRSDKIVNNEDSDFNKTGGNGNAYLATAKIGKALLNIKINRAITAIQKIEDTP